MHAHALDQDGAFNGSPEDEDTARRTRSSEASRDASRKKNRDDTYSLPV